MKQSGASLKIKFNISILTLWSEGRQLKDNFFHNLALHSVLLSSEPFGFCVDLLSIVIYTTCRIRAALTIGLGGAEARGPCKEGARDWLWSRLTGAPIAKATTPSLISAVIQLSFSIKLPFEIETESLNLVYQSNAFILYLTFERSLPVSAFTSFHSGIIWKWSRKEQYSISKNVSLILREKGSKM